MSLVIKPLSPALGAEIVGVDLRKELPEQTVADIVDAWHQHLIVVFQKPVAVRGRPDPLSPSISACCSSVPGRRRPATKRR